MYINPFICGFVACILVEFTATVIYTAIKNNKKGE